VRYHVELVEPVRGYLAQVEGLTDADRAAIVDAVSDELARDADRFLALYPLAHESYCFRYDYPYPTGATMFNFDFVVDASHQAMGVVRVVYVEHTSQPMH
jgi:hypothetical protein